MGSFSSKYLKDIWNLPNILTMLRLVLIPVFAGLFLAGYEKWALAVFIIASITDYLDGYLARKNNQITAFGKLMDPLADKLMVCTALLGQGLSGVFPWPAILIVMTKEVVMIIGGIYMLQNGIVVYSNILGKAAQFSFIAALILSFWHKEFVAASLPLDRIILWIAVALALVALVDYALDAVKKLKVKKISEYITKKVADKLIGMCKTEKENYEKYWYDISPFIKYGCLKDTKFCDKMNDYILFKDINDKYQTLPELLVPVEDEKKDDEKTTEDAKTEESKSDDAKEEEKEPERSTIYYVTDKAQQGQYIKMFKEQGMNAVILDHNIDTSFITQLEQRNEHYQFKRIDADVTDALKSDDAADLTEETNTLSDLFKKTLNNDKLTVKVESLKDADVASILTLSEQGRRMQDMMKMYAAGGMGGMDPNMFAADQTLTLNANNALVKYLFEHKDSEHSGMFAEQLYDLAMLSNQPLSAEAMTKFVKRSNDIMLLLTK